ncbi:MAG: radical SAM protein [Candidatus Woesearchaeota archaeon]
MWKQKKKQLYVVPDIFVSKVSNNLFIIYSPLAGKLSLVSSEFLSNFKFQMEKNFVETKKETIEDFIEVGLVSKHEVPRLERKIEDFFPTNVTLFLTSNCNLRCIYCYANAGDTKIRYMPIEIAKDAINLVISNSQRLNKKSIGLSFHGGGEPTYNWHLLVKCIEYAKESTQKKNIDLYTAISTNGIFSKKKALWLVSNIDEACLSWDGPKEIQDKNRPLPNGESSFEIVYRTSQIFLEYNFKFSVRATITNETVNRMEEIYDYFRDIGIKKIQIEPSYECGRCKTTNVMSPEPNTFVKNYLNILKKSERDNTDLSCSLGAFGIRSSFCGASGDNFCITPEGYITSCFEVTSREDPRYNIFFYGYFSKEKKKIIIDYKKREVLQRRQVYNIQYCKDCFVKWNCGGECLAKAASLGDLFNSQNINNVRCLMQKLIMVEKFNYLLEGV